MTQIHAPVPIVGFAAYSGTGKTTLLTALIPLLTKRGYRIGMIKHAHHSFDIDQSGKDSYKLRKAGTQQMLIASRNRWALMVENDMAQPEPGLQQMVNHLDSSTLDCILVEGFKHETFPKIELHRVALGRDPLFLHDRNIVAIACDQPLQTEHTIPRLDINKPQAIADFIIDTIIQPFPTTDNWKA
ncbi:MAG: molybdopterin-guanine dinucleotide biosynthesis protein B [Gammaproteobacteria bacterium]|jgi:molybdopterin-guanine dinucleotide biosynthesis protein MobB